MSNGYGKKSNSPILASVLHGPRDLRLEIRSVSDPAPHELQIAIKRTGLCGSDVAYYKNFRNGDLQAVAPLSLGHESAGVVVAMGESVQGFHIGQRVALEVGVPCDDCRTCQRGRYNLCAKMRFRSSAKSVPHYQGCLQERINHPAKWCHKIPSHVSLDSAALLEPLSVAIHAVRRSFIEQGDTVVVYGAGTVGLLVAAMAKLSGATTVLISDVDSGRVEYALHNGFATKGYINTKTSPLTELSDKLMAAKETAVDVVDIACADQPDAEGADVTFDCTGKEICIQAGLYTTRPGGQLVMVGMGTPIQTLPVSAAHLREIDIIGIFRYANTYATGIKILSSGVLPCLDNMVTHRFQGLDAVPKAFEVAGRTVDHEGSLVLKVVIET
ncbi:GroES-like protein [Viridothelium virens]|uniref:GroES-like protein n=1 Tax=Viridothelium virens TaxID=1048519 RepID=A0A6A6H717_VIRVR|nr:GroES-like protein [Viridothelium virens]